MSSEYDRQKDIEAEGQRAAIRHYDRPFHVTENGSHFLRWEPTPQEIITRQVADHIAQDREGKIRQALIDLGWTPPAAMEG